MDAPLAERLRPSSLDEVVGQAHLLGATGPLRRIAEGGRLPSMVLWGPPGTGKTTLARILANATGHGFLEPLRIGVDVFQEDVEADVAKAADISSGRVNRGEEPVVEQPVLGSSLE